MPQHETRGGLAFEARRVAVLARERHDHLAHLRARFAVTLPAAAAGGGGGG